MFAVRSPARPEAGSGGASAHAADHGPDRRPPRLPRGSGPLLLLCLVTLTVLAAGYGLRDPWPPDEPRYALVAKEMADSGQWLFPTRGGHLYPDKPPLFFWAIAAAYKLLGDIRLAFLLPSLLASLSTLLLVYDLARRLWTRPVGLYAASALLLSIQFVVQGRVAQIDAMLAFWVTLGLYGLLRHLLLGPAWGWYRTGFAAMGFGIITKGVGFLPLLVFLPWAWAHWRQWRPLRRIRGSVWQWGSGPVMLVAAVAVWLLPMLMVVASSGDPALTAYRDNILFHQTGERYVAAWHHHKPWWYYLVAVIPLFWLPLTLLLPWTVPAWRRRLRRGDARFLILLGWVVLVVSFFSLSPGKRGVYMLPALPGFVLATAPLLPGLLRRRDVQALAFTVLVLLALGLTGGALWLASGPRILDELPETIPWPAFLPVAVAAGTALLWALPGPRRGVLGLSGFLLSLWLVVGWLVQPVLDPVRSARPFMAEVGRRIGPDAQLGLLWWKEQLVLLADRPVTAFEFRGRPREVVLREALHWLDARGHRWLLLPTEQLAPCFDPRRAIDLGERHQVHWALVNRRARTTACEGRPPPS